MNVKLWHVSAVKIKGSFVDCDDRRSGVGIGAHSTGEIRCPRDINEAGNSVHQLGTR